MEKHGVERPGWYQRFGGGIDRLVAGPYWKLRALCAVVALALFRAFPNYDVLDTNFFQTKWRDVQVKFDHPLIDMSRIFSAGSHESKLTFRLTVPVLAHVLHLHEVGLLIVFAIAGVALLYLVLKMAFALTGNKRVALLVCLATACAWPGEAAFQELRGGYYDALALCLLLGACAARSSLLVGALVFLAAWTDERALLAASFVFLLYVYESTGDIRSWLAGKPAAVIVGAAAYLASRESLTVAQSYTLATSGVGFAVLARQVNVIPIAIWSGLAGCWILVCFGALALFRQRRYFFSWVFCAAMAGMIVASLAVVDVTRSMAYCLPALLVTLAALGKSENVKRLEKLAAISAAISFLVPTFYLEGSTGLWLLYPLPIQIARWMGAWTARNPL
ncbi:MAG TPA: hypothetical protein VME17_19590 [Bryobacteraceae bacterium]|nr:hypothetical protein [Bryobacteraceae bacterium]